MIWQKHPPSLDFIYINTHWVPMATGTCIDYRCNTQHHPLRLHLYLDKQSTTSISVTNVTYTESHTQTILILYFIKQSYYLDIGHWDCQHHFLSHLHLNPPCHNFSFFLQWAETSHRFSDILPLILSLWKYNVISFFSLLL